MPPNWGISLKPCLISDRDGQMQTLQTAVIYTHAEQFKLQSWVIFFFMLLYIHEQGDHNHISNMKELHGKKHLYT